MARKLKRPDGDVVEEGGMETFHLCHNGELCADMSEPTRYTGRFAFEYPDGTRTRWYTKRTAPKWLLVLYEEATHKR